jgi:guanylate kinase
MEKMIAQGEFLETTEFSSNLYGTRLLNTKFYLFQINLFLLVILVKKPLKM